ncbi:MAG: hypothetical protein JWQ33_1726, partial [Ramlibacter sp.]|nr:hypothetical protein [Ramlibacter sp.]
MSQPSAAPAPLPLTSAARIVEAALQEARKLNLHPMTVAVLDAGGHLVAFQREDGSGILRPQIASGKAWGVQVQLARLLQRGFDNPGRACQR